jgi:hypothetical protein
MVDRLEHQILEIIGNASSLVRTVTRREIESGVLYPSVTAMDIRRNLPSTIQLSVVESRLQLLEKDGFIFNDGGRWWLTRKGQQEVGRPTDQQPFAEKRDKPVSSQIEESFAEHGGPTIQAENESKPSETDNLLVELEDLYINPQLTKEERTQNARKLIRRLLGDEESLKEYLESRSLELTSEIEKLEDELTKKRNELQRIQHLVGKKIEGP